MELIDYFNSLSEEERSEYAGRVPTTVKYLVHHIMKPRPKKIKGASIPYIQKLANASNGEVSFLDACAHFADRKTYTGSDSKAA